jgi:hypothetical protein
MGLQAHEKGMDYLGLQARKVSRASQARIGKRQKGPRLKPHDPEIRFRGLKAPAPSQAIRLRLQGI